MPHYLLVHSVTQYPGSQQDWVESWRELRLAARNVEGVRWLQSFYDPDAEELYCQWEAADPDTILTCFSEDQLAMAPVKSVREIVLFDPHWLDETEDAK